mmetsp:Transcript_19247/g.35617  ORF Transcript_19247/g.35617 Transcript_19247/m.35617 type:complete len:242 (-) Transcript_19247:553-1278(-)
MISRLERAATGWLSKREIDVQVAFGTNHLRDVLLQIVEGRTVHVSTFGFVDGFEHYAIELPDWCFGSEAVILVSCPFSSIGGSEFINLWPKGDVIRIDEIKVRRVWRSALYRNSPPVLLNVFASSRKARQGGQKVLQRPFVLVLRGSSNDHENAFSFDKRLEILQKSKQAVVHKRAEAILAKICTPEHTIAISRFVLGDLEYGTMNDAEFWYNSHCGGCSLVRCMAIAMVVGDRVRDFILE